MIAAQVSLLVGLNGSPAAGDDFIVVENEARAREVVEYRQREIRNKQASAGARGTVEQTLTAIAAGHADELPILIKTDVHGSEVTECLNVSQMTQLLLDINAAVGNKQSDILLRPLPTQLS